MMLLLGGYQPGVLAEGVHMVRIEVMDKAGNMASKSITFVYDITPPVIEPLMEEIADYVEFRAKANITDAGLKDVVFFFNSTPMDYDITGGMLVSECLGPFAKDVVLNFTVIAEDGAGNIAVEEFLVDVVEGEVKLEGQGKLEEDGRSVKVELEARWKKGEAKGEFQLQEKDREGKFKAHGKILSLYRDCSGVFRISGAAKVEIGEGKDKVRADVAFNGWITEEEIRIVMNGKEYVVPAKVKIREKTKGGGED